MDYNLARVHEAVEEAYPDRPCIIFHDRHMSYRAVGDRTRQVANALRARGCATPIDRGGLAGHQSGQDHLALYLHNGNEYLEAMLGSYKARVAPFNVNYRYVAEELRYLLDDSGACAVVYHSAFAPVLDAVRGELPRLRILWQVADDSGHALLEGAEWYEDALSSAPTDLDDEFRATWSPDDLYILYTGGTTGMPKGVLWRQADIFVAALGGRQSSGDEWDSLDEIVSVAAAGGARLMPAPPFMHGAAHWMAFNAFTGGNTLVIPDVVERFDPVDVLNVVADQSVNVLLIVGDAFGRPLVEELEANEHDTSSLLALVSGGAALSARVKERLLQAVPAMMVLDGLGASETGAQAYQATAAGQTAETGTFSPGPGMCILSEDLTRLLEPGDDEVGWLGQQGRVPLGYLGDEAKTAKTFPVIDGVRYAVPGDRARVRADGTLERFLGRDSVTINTGGEKVFAEEVEAALTAHPAVHDVIVCGRPSARWGSEVVAIVQLAPGSQVADEDLLEEAERHVARYKLPKAIIRREALERSPSGKADYRWARAQAESS